MSIIYDQARREVHDMAAEILSTHHPELKLADGSPVRLCILMATNEDPASEEPAVKLHNYPCAAVISIIPYKQRVDKRADAEIIIDEKAWNDMTEPQQRALLDHEITHLQFQVDDIGMVKTDDTGRPKLKMRLHDFDFGGFRTIARRYGADAPEVQAARAFEKDYGADVLKLNELFDA